MRTMSCKPSIHKKKQNQNQTNKVARPHLVLFMCTNESIIKIYYKKSIINQSVNQHIKSGNFAVEVDFIFPLTFQPLHWHLVDLNWWRDSILPFKKESKVLIVCFISWMLLYLGKCKHQCPSLGVLYHLSYFNDYASPLFYCGVKSSSCEWTKNLNWHFGKN